VCATYQFSFDDISDEVTKKYGSDAADRCFNMDFHPKGNAPVVGSGNKVSLLKWGFPMKGSGNVVFNARAESLTEKAMFRTSLQNRCLIPTTSFYEWDKEKRKYKVNLETRRLFYFAGLWKAYLIKRNKEYYFTIVTTAPNEQIKEIHSRMPAIIAPEEQEARLNDDAEALKLLRPYEESLIIWTA
jgi:putative SOS response-associated peptidase YedK